jgi:hypothetical protein
MRASMLQAELTLPELWLRYFGLGGTGTELEVEAYIDGGVDGSLDDAQHDVLAHALNERFAELAMDDRVPYVRD